MVVSRDESGQVSLDVQGKEFPEEQVELLLAGKWDEVTWVPLVQKLEFWTDDVLPGDSTFQGTFANLHGMKSLLFKTMKMLKLARNGESEDSSTA